MMTTGRARPDRLLLLTHRFPYPPNRGDRIRSYNLLRVLSEKYQVTLGCTIDEPVAEECLEHINKICDRVIVAPLHRTTRMPRAIGGFLRGQSLTEGMFRSPALHRKLQRIQNSNPFDVVVVFCSSMYGYVENAAFEASPVVVDLVDVDSKKWEQMSRESALGKRWLYRSETSRVAALEQRIAKRASGVVLVSDLEASLFRNSIDTQVPVHGISNGVDTDYFQPRKQSTRRQSTNLDSDSSAPLQLVFVGVLDYSPNVEGICWFCQDVLPELRRNLSLELKIVGRRPSSKVRSLDSIQGVTVIGDVPDVRPYLHQAHVAISPLKLARGIQNKVLEAMACQLPVVLTTPSAEGIDAVSGQQFLIADTTVQWQDAITKLAGDRQLRQSLGDQARQLVKHHYSWPARLHHFTQMLDQVAIKN